MSVYGWIAAANRKLERGLELTLLVLLFVFLSLILYQVASRNLPVLPPIYWTEELSRFSLQWTIMLGAAIGVYRSDHFVLDAFPQGWPIERFSRCAREFALLGIALFFVIEGWAFAETGWRRRSTAAQIPMFFVYAAFFVSGAFMLLFQIQRVALLLTRGIGALDDDLGSVLVDEPR